MPKKQRLFWLAALVAAWLVDFLFWSKDIGIAFPVWTLIVLSFGFGLSWLEGKRPHWRSLLLAGLILFFATVPAWRQDPLPKALSVLLTLGGMILLTATFLEGFWPWYRIRDHVVESAKVIFGGFSGAAILASRQNKEVAAEGTPKPSAWKRVLPILRGVLIALPIVAVLGILLSSADPVFGDWVKRLFDLEKLPEYIFRLIYILIIAGFLVGIYLKAIHPAKPAEKPDPVTPWMKPFLGWTESGIVLGAVNLLFIAFIIIQVRYLFGGEANITETGYTYAEYARRGFGELVAVAVLSLGLYLVLGTVTRQDKKGAKTGLMLLSILLMFNVLVLLASSFQRLRLYEDAYGFTYLRTHTHIFIFWLAGLILAAVALEILRRRGQFALALLVCVVGFGISVAVINQSGFIVDRNVARAQMGHELDVAHLNTLSDDAIPALIRNFNEPVSGNGVKDGLGAALACRQKLLEEDRVYDWREFNLSRARAARLLEQNAASWSDFQPEQDDSRFWTIQVDGETINCNGYTDWID